MKRLMILLSTVLALFSCAPMDSDNQDKFLEDNVNVVYRKKIKLTYNAIRNLILQIYHNVPFHLPDRPAPRI